jgi:thioredoxin 1
MSSLQDVPSTTDATFAADTAQGLVAVDFTAEWCGPCRTMGPAIAALARDYEDRVRVLQLDADANPRTLVSLGVRGLPTVLLLRDGDVVDRVVGAVPAPVLRARIDALFADAGATAAGR